MQPDQTRDAQATSGGTREVGDQRANDFARNQVPLASRNLATAVAMVCHEANRAYCLTLGDASQQPWQHAEAWQRDSAVHGVEAVLSGAARTPEQQHQAWMDEKIKDGWTFGPVKDATKKLHPCLVPYGQLPPEQQRKDHLFRAIVSALTTPMGAAEGAGAPVS